MARGITLWSPSDGAATNIVCFRNLAFDWAPTSEDLTMTVWARIEGDSPGSATPGHPILCAWQTGGDIASITCADATPGGSAYQMEARTQDVTDGSGYTTGNLDTATSGVDVFYAVTVESAGATQTVRAYMSVDGDTANPALLYTDSGLDLAGTVNRIYLGWFGLNGCGNNFSITNFKLWKSLLSASDLKTEKLEAPTFAGCLLWHKFGSLSNLGAESGYANYALSQFNNGTITVDYNITNASMDPGDLTGSTPTAIAGSAAGTSSADAAVSPAPTAIAGTAAGVATVTGAIVDASLTAQTLVPTADTNVPASWATTGGSYFGEIDETVASYNETDYVIGRHGTSAFFALTDISTSQFDAMSDTATVNVRLRGDQLDGATPKLYAQLVKADETSALSAEVATAAISSEAFATVAITLTSVDTGEPKATWDAALLKLRIA